MESKLTAYAHIGDNLAGALFLLMEDGAVVESIEFPGMPVEKFAEHLVKYIQLLGMDSEQVYCKVWGSGRILRAILKDTHGITLGAIKGSDRMRRVDMKVMGLNPDA